MGVFDKLPVEEQGSPKMGCPGKWKQGLPFLWSLTPGGDFFVPKWILGVFPPPLDFWVYLGVVQRWWLMFTHTVSVHEALTWLLLGNILHFCILWFSRKTH